MAINKGSGIENEKEVFVGLYDVRDGESSDTPFIRASFLNGVYYGDRCFTRIPKEIFMSNYKKVIDSLLTPGKAQIKVACLKDDPSTIIGYSILSNDFQTIHWVYVKQGDKNPERSWRNRGIGRSLVPKYPTAVTHLTKLGETLLNKFPNLIYDPFRY